MQLVTTTNSWKYGTFVLPQTEGVFFLLPFLLNIAVLRRSTMDAGGLGTLGRRVLAQ